MATKAEKRAQRLKQRKQEVQKQRAQASSKARNKKLITGGIILLAVVFFGAVIYDQLGGEVSTQYDDFAICLTNAGAGMYGTDWCPNCQNQKQMFGKSFRNIVYINCDVNSAACDNQDVTGYPTWIFADQSRLTGTQSLASLAEKTGCELP